MDVLLISVDRASGLSVSLNWIAVAIIALCTILFLTKGFGFCIKKKEVEIDEFNLGVGGNGIKLKYDLRDREIAYKIWVELSTRKIGLPIDEENDVIVEVYNSWYSFFEIARELLKEMPASKFRHSKQLIELTENILNCGLRPHLTKWQARFRKWYDNEIRILPECEPQEIQKKYAKYDELISDIKAVNLQMLAYKTLLHRIAFDE